ncbi:MAG: Arogenate dehydrogenase [uncultured Nocardioidaceae bacterium]|uniref:Prephenate dehydrogenase n=1 Tax=uncultured Nocardioidaceae bacterium TaxID=253824 RepID=A0A6J4N8Q9_9ACTN|nr:MAG: Arogenate dehydrogenase [uncultured Nocardioidaceae bacterium]
MAIATPGSEPVPTVGRWPSTDGPVLVVGAGLIGASVAMALTAAGAVVHLTDKNAEAAHVAASRGAGSDTLPVPVDVRLVVVATPPDHLGPEIVAALTTYPHAAVTDVGSVKAQPLAQVLAAEVDAERYVGGHPMAGSERSGPLAAAADLFAGRAWAVVGRADCDPDALTVVRSMVHACGATAVDMETDDHDRAVARTSHLPHLVAAVTAASLGRAPRDHLALTGQGVRDVTRIAAGDPALWGQILLANAGALAELLGEVRDDLDAMVQSLRVNNPGPVEQILRAGVAGTEAIPGKHGGEPLPLVTVSVAIPDEPGALARLFSVAGEAGVNIEDLRIDHDPTRRFGLVEIDVAAEQAAVITEALVGRGWSTHR